MQFSQSVLIHLIQFSISTDFVYTQLNVYSQLNVKTVLQISLLKVQFQCQNTVPFQIIQFSISMQFKCKYGLIVKTFLFQFSQTIQFCIIMPLVLFNP